MWFASVHGGNLANRAFGIPRRADVVPADLRGPLSVRDSTSRERARYGVKVGLEYSKRFVKSGALRSLRSLLSNFRR